MHYQYQSTKIIELGSCAFRQWKADSHCKFIHGYRLVAKFWFGCDSLDAKNWVVDFGGLKSLKQILETQFDHTLCIAGDDPALPAFQALHDQKVVDLRIMAGGVGIEKTAEWCLKVSDAHIRDLTKNRCWVEKVEVWEHEKNSAIASYQHTRLPEHNPYATDKYIAEQAELNFNPTPAATAVAAPAPEVQKAINETVAKPAAVGNQTTTGWGNPFGGTSWGS